MIDEPKIAIVLLNWNFADDTIECINSLKKVDYKNFKIIVVDNGSANNSWKTIEDTFKSEIILIRNEQNLGFSGGNNKGIEQALNDKVDYIFVLNNDTIVDKEILKELVCFMEDNPQAGIVAPVMFFYNRPDYIWFAGGIMDRNTGIGDHIGYGEKFSSKFDKIIECNFLTGCGMFFRSKVFKEVGLFDTAYFHTSEDADLCFRVMDQGYKLYLNPKARLWHKCAASLLNLAKNKSFIHPSSYIYYEVRNRLLFIKKNHQKGTLIKSLYKIIYFHLYEIYELIKNRNFKSIVTFFYGIWDFALGRFGEKKF
ncbi:MAG: glycosyltransferase family 2 protein [bacterium]|nr:glycosyltransferase family 2 protein [bacterium]